MKKHWQKHIFTADIVIKCLDITRKPAGIFSEPTIWDPKPVLTIIENFVVVFNTSIP
jgi:hypothetical protein